jgi:hypothetical protein
VTSALARGEGNMTKVIMALLFTSAMLLVNFTSAIAEDKEIARQQKRIADTVVCGRIELTVVSDYVEYSHGFRHFVDQTATIGTGAKSTVFILDKNEADIRQNQYGDQSFGVLSYYQCVKGRGKKDYAFLGYSVGGNCADCEWVDIIDEYGEVLASDKKNARQKFSTVRKKLGIAKDYHEGQWNSLRRR